MSSLTRQVAVIANSASPSPTRTRSPTAMPSTEAASAWMVASPECCGHAPSTIVARLLNSGTLATATWPSSSAEPLRTEYSILPALARVRSIASSIGSPEEENCDVMTARTLRSCSSGSAALAWDSCSASSDPGRVARSARTPFVAAASRMPRTPTPSAETIATTANNEAKTLRASRTRLTDSNDHL